MDARFSPVLRSTCENPGRALSSGGSALIRVTRPGPGLLKLAAGSPEERASLRREFAQRHRVLFRRLLDDEILHDVTRIVEDADFYTREHDGIGTEDCMHYNPAHAILILAANDPRLFELIQDITGCGPIGCFDGRVYRLDPAQSHYDSWHSDLGDNRLVAMSLNLTTAPYAGGTLELKDNRSGTVFEPVQNSGPGDALLFRLGPHLRHRVTPVVGEVPRVAFAGWFKSHPSFPAVLAGKGWFAP